MLTQSPAFFRLAPKSGPPICGTPGFLAWRLLANASKGELTVVTQENLSASFNLKALGAEDD